MDNFNKKYVELEFVKQKKKFVCKSMELNFYHK